jgi:hypothetical protein
MADAELFPEFISNGAPEADIQKIKTQLCAWLQQPNSLDAARRPISELAEYAAKPGASARTASWLLQRLGAVSEKADAA